MNKMIIFSILLILIPAVMLAGCASSAGAGDKQTDEETDGETNEETYEDAVLYFSSFSGGGYEYSVSVDDPEIVDVKTRYEYEANAEEIDGASFDYIVSFTGLKAGETTVTVYGISPNIGSENSVYDVYVDEALHVTLTPVRMLSTMFVYRSGDINYDTYNITMDPDGYQVSVNDEQEQPLSADTVSAVMDVIDEYDMVSWDGFSESEDHVLDGESFWLDFTLTDGTDVHASGDNVFPENYFKAMGKIYDILRNITKD